LDGLLWSGQDAEGLHHHAKAFDICATIAMFTVGPQPQIVTSAQAAPAQIALSFRRQSSLAARIFLRISVAPRKILVTRKPPPQCACARRSQRSTVDHFDFGGCRRVTTN
jgi:hypothetical protein